MAENAAQHIVSLPGLPGKIGRELTFGSLAEQEQGLLSAVTCREHESTSSQLNACHPLAPPSPPVMLAELWE